MENKVNPWKANLTNGLIMGLIGIVYSLVMYFFDLTLNSVQKWIFVALQFVILYFLVKMYRDNYKHGLLSYGEALGAGMIIFLYYSIIAAIFMYILYTLIDPNMVDKQMVMAEEELLKRGIPQDQIDISMNVTEKLMIPAVQAPFSIIINMFYGLIISLIVAAFVRKEGNPLIDAAEEEPVNN